MPAGSGPAGADPGGAGTQLADGLQPPGTAGHLRAFHAGAAGHRGADGGQRAALCGRARQPAEEQGAVSDAGPGLRLLTWPQFML